MARMEYVYIGGGLQHVAVGGVGLAIRATDMRPITGIQGALQIIDFDYGHSSLIEPPSVSKVNEESNTYCMFCNGPAHSPLVQGTRLRPSSDTPPPPHMETLHMDPK